MPGVGDNVDFNTGNMYGRADAFGATNYGEAATTGGALGTNKLWLPIWSGEVIRAYDHPSF